MSPALRNRALDVFFRGRQQRIAAFQVAREMGLGKFSGRRARGGTGLAVELAGDATCAAARN